MIMQITKMLIMKILLINMIMLLMVKYDFQLCEISLKLFLVVIDPEIASLPGEHNDIKPLNICQPRTTMYF